MLQIIKKGERNEKKYEKDFGSCSGVRNGSWDAGRLRQQGQENKQYKEWN